MTAPLLLGEGVSVRRGARLVLAPFDLSLKAGERVAIYGPNGAGKSTMLQVLAGLLPAASGAVSFEGQGLGRDIPLLAFHRRTAAVFQEPLLLRGTVRHNVELGLRLRGVAAKERAVRARTWLERLHIAHLAERPVGMLSGGEAQRTSLARALVLDPEVVFLDEPFAALDAPTRTRLADELAEILDEGRIATLFVTHDIDEAAALCERCVVLDAGHVAQQDRMAAVLGRPASRRVAEIVGLPNLFAGRVVAADGDGSWLDWGGQRIRTDAPAPIGAQVDFLIRRERIALSTAAPDLTNQCCGRVDRNRRGGGRGFALVLVGESDRLMLRSELVDRLAPGEAVTVAFPPDAVWVFPEQIVRQR